MAEKKPLTRSESRSYLREKYYTAREKILMTIAVVIIDIVLFHALFYSIGINNPLITVIIALMIVIFLPISVFLIDSVYYEHE